MAAQTREFPKKAKTLAQNLVLHPSSCRVEAATDECVQAIRELTKGYVSDALGVQGTVVKIQNSLRLIEGDPDIEPLVEMTANEAGAVAVVAYYVPKAGRAIMYTFTALECFRRDGDHFVPVASSYGFLDNHRLQGTRVSPEGQLPIILLLHGQNDHF